MNWQQEQEAIKAAIATFPATFALKAFPGDTFRISTTASYFGGEGNNTLMLYTERLHRECNCKTGMSGCGEWVDFAKGTPEELRRQVALSSWATHSPPTTR